MTDPSDASSLVLAARQRFHEALFANGLLSKTEDGIASISDQKNARSRAISSSLLDQLGSSAAQARLKGQVAGAGFEQAVEIFLRETFCQLAPIRSGNFEVARLKSISDFQQYKHLAHIASLAEKNRDLKVALGRDYLIKPDVVISRSPLSDDEINREALLIDSSVADRTGLRATNDPLPILHASISCKWTLRSDRAQNARSEALNLIRNRKGKLPHAVVITAEPSPSRVASLALGTGDIDCVYFLALPELIRAVNDHGTTEARETLEIMVEGERLRDISDLPFDLAT